MLTGRLIQIMDILKSRGNVTVSELARVCQVTEKTIRLDLDMLEKMDMVTRVHGGALLANGYQDIYPAISRNQMRVSEKQSIARAALQFIEDGDAIFLDAGSSVLELAKLIEKNVIVITNDEAIVSECLNHKNITLYCTGGMLHRSDINNIYVGPDTLNFINHYKTRKCFVGCSAVNYTRGLMVFSSIEAEIKRAIVEASEHVYCLADNSKIGKSAFVSFASAEKVEACITDGNIPPEKAENLRSNNFNVVIGKM